jgi:hypothetical protein
MKVLTFEDGIIRLGGEELPGLLVSLRIDGKVRYDEQKVDGASGKSKTPQGWDDQTVAVILTLTTDGAGDCYEKLANLTPFFRKTDTRANPQIYTLTNRHAQARGVRQIVFDRLESTESITSDTIRVSLGFTEHIPPIVRTEAAEAKSPTPQETAEEQAATPEEDKLLVDVNGGDTPAYDPGDYDDPDAVYDSGSPD